MPDVNQSKVQDMLSELKQLGVLKEIDIPELVPGTVYEVTHKTLPTDIIELEGVPTPVGDKVNKSVTITRGKLWAVVL